MYRHMIAAATLMCLLSTTALAQTSTATGTGVGVSESNSAAGAIAVNKGNGGNSSLTINNPANSTTTSNINQKLSGSTRTETVVSGTQTVKNVPGVIAPGLAAAGLETCLGSASGGVSAVGFGVSGGSTYKDEDCTARLDSRTLFSMGLKAAAVARLCVRPDIWRSMPEICQKYWPVSMPLPYGVVAVDSRQVTTPYPLVAPRPINVPNYGYEQPYAMGGTSMEVVDGKTGLTRPCSDYNAVRQKCLNWADAPRKIKLASTPKPKKSVAVVAAVKPVAASAATEPKKED